MICLCVPVMFIVETVLALQGMKLNLFVIAVGTVLLLQQMTFKLFVFAVGTVISPEMVRNSDCCVSFWNHVRKPYELITNIHVST